MKATGLFLGVLASALFAPILSATTFNFTSQSTTPTISGGVGDSICFSSAGTQLSSCSGTPYLTINAWSNTGTSGVLAAAGLGQYGGAGFGLGVCNSGEMPTCGAPQHEVDNSGHLDFVLFQFNSTLNGTFSFLLNSVCQCDTDASYWYGSAATSSINGATIPAGLNSILTGGTSLYGGPTSPAYSRTFNFSANGVTTILLGANITNSDDYFKIGSLTYTPNQSTPEPISFVLAGSGLIGIYFFGRRELRAKA